MQCLGFRNVNMPIILFSEKLCVSISTLEYIIDNTFIINIILLVVLAIVLYIYVFCFFIEHAFTCDYIFYTFIIINCDEQAKDSLSPTSW